MIPNIILLHYQEELYQRIHEMESDGWQRSNHATGKGVAVQVMYRQGRGPLGRFRRNQYTVLASMSEY